jgi:hypothetical protein
MMSPEDRIDRGAEADVPALIDSVVGLVGNRFGGAWLGETETGNLTLHVGVVRPTADDESGLKAAAPPGVTVRVVGVRYSERQLEGFERRLRGLIETRPTVNGTGYDVTRNAATISLERTDEQVIREARQIVPEDALRIVLAPGLEGRAV